ncbi:hypothetical protein EZV73_26570 [Acidaminobacter sp. JC074]|uniref:hypothetical protein n=1 Tax=Acidaminobacter sp. JC074 TaxID=2530199 RepID=UPI001F0D7C19|nr:hypothetical protein [Acidaminobacter sp. JC074]MCH4891171.1 hypothetical protein [Acidaminobacter sp. JC074]
MGSTNKTPKTGLNQYIGTDHFKRDDYNTDMSKIDAALDDLDEPIVPVVNVRELQISPVSNMKTLKIVIKTNITGGSITIKKNDETAKPLKLNGQDVVELLASDSSCEVYEEETHFELKNYSITKVKTHVESIEIHRRITFGTANPSGGSHGDIYLQYE